MGTRLRVTRRSSPAVDHRAHTIMGSILVVDDEPMMARLVGRALTAAGADVRYAADGVEALEHLGETLPDLVISDVNMPRMDGFQLLTQIRSQPRTRGLSVILLTARGDTEDVVAGLGLGADDYLIKPFHVPELLARVRAKLERPPAPGPDIARESATGLLSEDRFAEELAREVARAEKTRREGVLAYIHLHELPRLRTRFSQRVQAQIERQAVALINEGAGPLDVLSLDKQDRFMLLQPETSEAGARERLTQIMERISAHEFAAAEEIVQITPVVGFAAFGDHVSASEVAERCAIACDHAERQLDLLPVDYRPTMRPRREVRHAGGSRLLRLLATIPVQILITQLLAMGVPLAVYFALDAAGVNIVPIVYIVVVIALLVTAALIWAEGFLALRHVHPPHLPEDEYVPATAIIAAYLPNEAATIVETIKSFQRIDYPAGLQILLAYNTPRPLPVEKILREMSQSDPRFRVIAVEGSESKAQNVNTALSEASGEFIGIFDADHHPDPQCFRRAWRWLASGYDVVQGHCMVRNGYETWISKMVAVEFEAIYAVSHPGRARLHGFGIFGGTNGYWKARVLREIRMHASMLTEDIDSSIRTVIEGHRIASDPLIVSRELAPVTMLALWNQRKRWAQGWFQVSYSYLFRALASRKVSFRQKLGLVHLMAWREAYPWVTNQIIPIIIFWAVKLGGIGRIDWLVPVFVATTIFTLTSGPSQVLFVWRLAHRDIRRHRRWLVFYLVASLFFYTAFKNLISVVAQVNEAMQQRKWMITPRSARAADTAAERLRRR